MPYFSYLDVRHVVNIMLPISYKVTPRHHLAPAILGLGAETTMKWRYLTREALILHSIYLFEYIISMSYNIKMEKIPLKKIVNHQNKTTIVSFFAMIMFGLYAISGVFQIGEPRFLPLSDSEMNIPFIIDSIWVYVMMYPFLLWSIFSYKCEENFNKVLYSFIIVSLITIIIFQLFPVGYPREFYPLPHANSPSVNLFYKIRWIDSPMNCFPSLHVSLCFLFSFGHWSENKKLFWISLFITILISISTLTTKQHYIVDVVAGLILSFVIFTSVKRFTKIVSPLEQQS